MGGSFDPPPAPLDVRGLIIFLFEAVHTCFLLRSRKFAAVLLKNTISVKIQDGGQNGGHVVKTAAAIATVLN